MGTAAVADCSAFVLLCRCALITTQNQHWAVWKGAGKLRCTGSKRLSPSNVRRLLPCFLLPDSPSETSVAAQGSVQDWLFMRREQLVCEAYKNTAGGFVEVLFADHLKYVISSEIEEVH